MIAQARLVYVLAAITLAAGIGLLLYAGVGVELARTVPTRSVRLPIEYPLGLLAAGCGVLAVLRRSSFARLFCAWVLLVAAIVGPASALLSASPGEAMAAAALAFVSFAGLVEPVPRVSMLFLAAGLAFSGRAMAVGRHFGVGASLTAVGMAAAMAAVVGVLSGLPGDGYAPVHYGLFLLGAASLAAACAALLICLASAAVGAGVLLLRWVTGPAVAAVASTALLFAVGMLYQQSRRDSDWLQAHAAWLGAAIDSNYRTQVDELRNLATELDRAEVGEAGTWLRRIEERLEQNDGLAGVGGLDGDGKLQWALGIPRASFETIASILQGGASQSAARQSRASGRSSVSRPWLVEPGERGFTLILPLMGGGGAGGALVALFRVDRAGGWLARDRDRIKDAVPQLFYGDEAATAPNSAHFFSRPAVVPLGLGDGQWRLSLRSIPGQRLATETILAAVVIAGGLVTAALLYAALRFWTIAVVRARGLAELNEELRRSGELLGSAGEVARVGGWELDFSDDSVRWTAQTFALFDRHQASAPTLQEFVGYFAGEARDAVQRALDEARQLCRSIDLEASLMTGRRRRVWVKVIGCVRRQDGAPRSIYGAIQDITTERETLAALQASHARLDAIFATTGDGIITIDERGRIDSFNPAAERMFGYRADEIIGSNVSILMPEPAASEHDGYMQSYLKNGTRKLIGIGREVRGRRSDGSEFPLELAVNAATAGTERFFVGVTHDISRRKETEARLLAAKDAAERASRAKSEFLSRMSHELRTPMNAILGFAQILQLNSREPLTAAQTEFVGQIRKAGWHLLGLINEILDLARIDAGRMEMRIRPVSVAEVVRESVDLVTPLANERKVAITERGDALAKFQVVADPDRLRQVMLNLLTNATKYNRNGGRVVITATRGAPGRVRISVADTGQGLEAAQIARLFEPFDRLGAERTAIEGAGIGLTISKRLVELMGGEIGADSEVGIGSTFWIELVAAGGPAKTEDGGVAATGAGATVIDTAQGPGRRTILYVEDNPANLKLVERAFALRGGLRLVGATSGESGLTFARNERPDLILLDIALPGMDGFEVKRRLDADESMSGVPVVALSANAMASDLQRGRNAGFAEYLTKPIDLVRLLEVVDRLLAPPVGVHSMGGNAHG